MTIDVYSATGVKSGTLELPKDLFEAPVNHGLIHQAVVLQQSNERSPIAHAKSRGEVQGSTRKLYAQKHTGRARRGSARSPLLRGGGKAFGPRKDRNFRKDMPKSMRHAALCSSLTLRAKGGAIIGLEGYPNTIKTKEAATLLGKLPVELGRRILLVLPERHEALFLSTRNIPGIKTITASYLNPVDVMGARFIVFIGNAVEKAQAIFGKKDRGRIVARRAVPAAAPKQKQKEKPAKKVTKKPVAKKPAAKKAPAKKSPSSK